MRAALLYARMSREGYIPSPILRTTMYIVKMAELLDSQEDFLGAIMDGLQSAPSEKDLVEVLRVLSEGLSASPAFVDRIVESFLAKHPPGYKLSNATSSYVANLHLRAGDKEGARRWFIRPDLLRMRRWAPQTGTEDAHASPYANILTQLSNEDPAFAEYEAVFANMREEMPSLVVDLPFLNGLIENEVSRGRYRAVFAIYNRMMASRSAYTTPDSTTFYHVFRAIQKFSHATARQPRARRRRFRRPANMPSPRAVYRDMLNCHEEHVRLRPSVPSPVLTKSVVHRALRMFMAWYDYAAAYVATRSFLYLVAYTGQSTLTTYRIVVNAVLERIASELPQLQLHVEQNVVWMYRFLGLDAFPLHLRSRLAADVQMVQRLLVIATEPRLSLEFVSVPTHSSGEGSSEEEPRNHVSPTAREMSDEDGDWDIRDEEESREYVLPTAREILEEDGGWVNPRAEFEFVPLLRIIRRAILASFEAEEMAGLPDVSEAIRRAKDDMLPGRV
ncbi:hypothetical protein C8Q74DRAFT_1265654 [Fomes fomentarius]|nr:hypothetical protein C8Q74DRAFT_1265654 [Fomes fomentarius]